MEQAVREIAEQLVAREKVSKKLVQKLKLAAAKKHGLPKIPQNSEILAALPEAEKNRLLWVLRRKPVRAASGVTVIAIQTLPQKCPGECVYCPGGETIGTPKSYTGREPATLRAAMYGYDPGKQVLGRIKQIETIGHVADKIELIIMGGTFPAMPKKYQELFILGALNAIVGKKNKTLDQAKLAAEKSEKRCVGITFETRPDYCGEKQIRKMLSLGATRVELGVQTTYPQVYKKINRGHGVEESIKSTRLLKDSCLKVCYHLMPGLPGSDPKKDLEMFKKIFKDPPYRPDMLKIYPCSVVKPEYGKTRLYEWWKQGKYEPYTCEQLVELLTKVKTIVPKWVRIMRITRDIPSNVLAAGCKKTNLRQLVQRELKKQGKECGCIRCRAEKILKKQSREITLSKTSYAASGGKEHFLSFEDKKTVALAGFLRLRFPKKTFIPNLEDSALVRELHVYGEMTPVGKKAHSVQHRDYGTRLLEEAEKMSRQKGFSEITVVSGLGVKEYYYSRGYAPDGYFVSKKL